MLTRSSSRTATISSSRPGLSTAIRLFHEMAVRVPAYKDFLKKQGVSASLVKTAADFHRLPIINKDNYLKHYPLDQLAWDGNLTSTRMISVSSGSSGQPFFWPHGKEQHAEGELIHRNIYEKIFAVSKKPTLVVVCFSMGTWIAGPFTLISSLGVSDRNNIFNVITPGIDKEDAVTALRHLSKYYAKIIITGYPPIVKDVIDNSIEQGVSFRRKDVSLLLAGEAVSEEWRDYVQKRVGSKDPFHSSVNIYGTADATIVGHETPYSIMIRRIYNKSPKLTKQVFGTPVLPTIAQYYPRRRYFEEIDGHLIFSARAGLPLCRYDIRDTGRVLSGTEITEPIKGRLAKVMAKNKLRQLDFWRDLPFVSLNGRNDFTITLYGLLIYPENIKRALIKKSIRDRVTGRFVMETKFDKDMEQYFEVKVELKKLAKPSRESTKQIKDQIVETLLRVNAEYRKLHKAIGERANPHVKAIRFEADRFKTSGPKHKWV